MPTSPWGLADIPDQTGRVAVVTGANSGIGIETARHLAGAGTHVVLAVRSVDRGERAAEDIASTHPRASLTVEALDLGSLESVRDAAQRLMKLDRLDLLINNAGVLYSEDRTTTDGFDLHLGTNHLGHFALTGLLLPKLLASPASRVVTVASIAHNGVKELDDAHLRSAGSASQFQAYCRSKFANLVFTYELDRRLRAAEAPTAALAAHPGGSATAIVRDIPLLKFTQPIMHWVMQRPTAGALPTVRAATDPNAVGGQYYGPDGFKEFRGAPVIVQSTPLTHDVALGRRLWHASEELTGVSYSV